MRSRLTNGLRRLAVWVQRPLIVLLLLFASGFASVGFVRQERTIQSLREEIAQRQQDLDEQRQQQVTLQAEVAALNDPAHYAQYAMLVARHTLILTRPGDTLLIVTWQSPGDPPATAPPPTNWKALLRAAGIPSP